MFPQMSKQDWKLCWSAFSSRCRTEFCVHLNQPSERVSLHLLHHFAPVRFYGNHTDAEFVSDRLFNKPETTNAITCRSRGETDP